MSQYIKEMRWEAEKEVCLVISSYHNAAGYYSIRDIRVNCIKMTKNSLITLTGKNVRTNSNCYQSFRTHKARHITNICSWEAFQEILPFDILVTANFNIPSLVSSLFRQYIKGMIFKNCNLLEPSALETFSHLEEDIWNFKRDFLLWFR